MPPESPATDAVRQPGTEPSARLAATVLDAPHAGELAAFYAELLGWTTFEAEQDWARIGPNDGGRPGLSFQREPNFQPPTWPSRTDRQQMQVHLDILVEDLDAAVARAEALGAQQADYQPQDGVRVMTDPVGHVFDLFVAGA
jgi:hypothetical protein